MRKPKDQKYRDMIVKKLDASMLIEAGAGSGKTTSLVDRMLALIGEGRCTVDRMTAVTFTRKAAAELKGRFQIALEDIVKQEKDPDRRGRYQSALAGLDHCRRRAARRKYALASGLGSGWFRSHG